MTVPLHPLTKPHLDKLAGLNEAGDIASAEEVERRVQELLNEWLRFYFSGNEFTTPTAGGAPDNRTFAACEIAWGHASPELPASKPLIHTQLTDRRDGDGIRTPGGFLTFKGDWTFNTFVRTHPQLPASPDAPGQPIVNDARATAERECRRVGDQLAWLLRGPHSQALSLKGVGQISVLSGPRLIQSGSWFLRQIIFSSRIIFRIASNPPG